MIKCSLSLNCKNDSCFFEQWCKHTCTCIAYWNSCSRCYSLAFCWLSRQVAPSVVNGFSSQSTHFQRLSFPFNIRYSIPYCHCKHGFLRHRLGIRHVPDTTGRHQCFKTHVCKGGQTGYVLARIKKGVPSAVGFLHCAGSGEGLFLSPKPYPHKCAEAEARMFLHE